MSQKYKIGDVVEYTPKNTLARIIATKGKPYHNDVMPFNKTQAVSDNGDYIIMFYKETNDIGRDWSGTLEVKEALLTPSQIDGIAHFE